MAINTDHMGNSHIEKARMLGALLPTIFAALTKRMGACPHCSYMFAMGSLLGTYAYSTDSTVGDEVTDGSLDSIVKIASLFHAGLTATNGSMTCELNHDPRSILKDFTDMPQEIQDLINDVMKDVMGNVANE